MEKELTTLKKRNTKGQIAHILKYIDYVFKGDDPEDYLRSTFPKIWNVYVIQYFDAQLQNGGFRQFLWNTQGLFNQDLQNALSALSAQEYLEAFEKILTRFNADQEEKNTFLAHDFSDEQSRTLRDDLREISWTFQDQLDQQDDIKKLALRLEEYIHHNLTDIAKELAKIRTEIIEYLNKNK